MTATDELRRRLDARGTEHADLGGMTEWTNGRGRICRAYTRNEPLTMDIAMLAVPPEQAIAATLGDASNGKERPLYFNLADEESDERVVVRKSELVRCLKHFREEILSSPGDYEHDMRDIGGRLWAADTATLGRGRLTADQVRECVGSVYLEGYSDGSANRGAHIDETDWQAIADELNAALGDAGNGSRWHELFGTPERAAKTMEDGKALCAWCDTQTCAKRGGECSLFDYDALLEWLKGSNE